MTRPPESSWGALPRAGVWSCSSLQSFMVPGSLFPFAGCGPCFRLWRKTVPKYRDQIPSPGLVVFPKPAPVLDFSFSLSDSVSYQGYTDDLKKFLKPFGLEEQKNLTDCANRNFWAEGSRIHSMSVSSFLTWSILWYGWSHIWLPIRKPLYSCEN